VRRGEAYAAKGDRTRALADFEAALGLKPDVIKALRPLGMAWFGDGAFADAAELLRFSERDPDPYVVLYRFLARRRAGEDAAAELAANASQLKSKAWPYPLIELHLGERTPQAVIEIAAGRPQEHLEAHFQIAQWHILRCEPAQARASLRLVAARYPHHLAECTIARADLKRLPQMKQAWEPRVRAVKA
jgi:lipoprotein NlpI